MCNDLEEQSMEGIRRSWENGIEVSQGRGVPWLVGT